MPLTQPMNDDDRPNSPDLHSQFKTALGRLTRTANESALPSDEEPLLRDLIAQIEDINKRYQQARRVGHNAHFRRQ
jgi:hypothetical protein